MPDSVEDRDWQRLDQWLWCARFMRHRADCTRFVEDGSVRLNRMPVDKPHARLRVGDVLTLPFARQVRVVQVLALARRRGASAEARALYREVLPDGGCGAGADTAYPPPDTGAAPPSRSI